MFALEIVFAAVLGGSLAWLFGEWVLEPLANWLEHL